MNPVDNMFPFYLRAQNESLVRSGRQKQIDGYQPFRPSGPSTSRNSNSPYIVEYMRCLDVLKEPGGIGRRP